MDLSIDKMKNVLGGDIGCDCSCSCSCSPQDQYVKTQTKSIVNVNYGNAGPKYNFSGCR